MLLMVFAGSGRANAGDFTDSSWTGGGRCDPDPQSNEPEFLKRR
jgi:hypothetical protein